MDNEEELCSLTRTEGDLLDAITIFKYKAITTLRPDISLVTDLVNPQNIAFLLNHPSEYDIMQKYNFTEVLYLSFCQHL